MKPLLWIVLIGFIARLAVAVVLPVREMYDHDSYRLVVDIAQRGDNVYSETERYNYSPIFLHILLFLARFPLPVEKSLQLLLCVVDTLNGLLIYAIARKWGVNPLATSAFYLLNPAVIFVVAYYAQFESIAFTPLLAALLVALRSHLVPAHAGGMR